MNESTLDRGASAADATKDGLVSSDLPTSAPREEITFRDRAPVPDYNEEELEPMDFDKEIIDAGTPPEEYMEAVYEKLLRNKSDPNEDINRILYSNIEKKPHIYDSLLWGTGKEDFQPNMEGAGNVSADTRDEILNGENLGKFSLLQIVSIHKYSESHRQEIIEAYEAKASEMSKNLGPLQNEIDLSNTPEGKAHSTLMLSDFILKNAGKESDIIKSMPENSSRRDVMKKLLYALDTERSAFKGANSDIVDTFKEQISSELKASQSSPDFSNMDDTEKARIAKNVELCSLLLKVPPYQEHMLGIDVSKLDFENIPGNPQSVFLFRETMLNDKAEMMRFFGPALEGATEKEISQKLMRAQVITLKEQTAGNNIDKFNEAVLSTAKSMINPDMNIVDEVKNIGTQYKKIDIKEDRSKATNAVLATGRAGLFAGEQFAKDVFGRIINSPAPDKAANAVLNKFITSPFDFATDFLNSLAAAIEKSGSKARKRALSDHTFGRMRKGEMNPTLSNRVLSGFYNKDTMNDEKKNIIKTNDGTETEIIAVDDKHVLVNRMVSRPLAGSPISSAVAVKLLQNEKDDNVKSFAIKDEDTGIIFYGVGDKQTTIEDIDNSINAFKEGKPYDALAPLQQRHREEMYEKEIKEEDGKLAEESRNDIISHIAALSKEPEKEPEKTVADNMLRAKIDKPKATGSHTERYGEVTDDIKSGQKQMENAAAKRKAQSNAATKAYLRQKPSNSSSNNHAQNTQREGK